MDYKQLFKEYQLDEEIKLAYDYDDFYDFLIEKKNNKMDNTSKLIVCYLAVLFFSVSSTKDNNYIDVLSNSKELLEIDEYLLEEFVFCIFQMFYAAQIRYAIDTYRAKHKKEFEDLNENGEDESIYGIEDFNEEDINDYVRTYHQKNTKNKNYYLYCYLIINDDLLHTTLELIKKAYPNFYQSWDVLELLYSKKKLNEEAQEALKCLNWVLYFLDCNVEDESMYYESNSNEEEIKKLYFAKYMDTFKLGHVFGTENNF